MGENDSYKDVFLAESADFIQQIIDGLLALEERPTDLEPIEVIFRGAHSLKGMSAAMSYERTADLTHKMEGLMDRVRKGEIDPSRQLINLMLEAVDKVRELITDESSGQEDVDPSALVEALEMMASTSSSEADSSSTVAHDESTRARPTDDTGLQVFRVRVVLEDSCVLKAVRAYMVIKRLAHMGEVLETVPDARAIEDEQFDRDFEVVLRTASTPDEIKDAVVHVSEVETAVISSVSARPEPQLAESESRPQGPRGLTGPRLSETQTVRVSIGHLDTLVDLVGELVILRSRLERLSDRRVDPELNETLDELQRISTELQYEVMQTRLVPVGNIFNRFPRMVRDLAVDLGKRVKFQMSGLEIELDRTVLDEIGDPLVHLLRNSIDHGIESSEARLAAGKPAVGRVALTATRERDHVAIEVSDDGKGINCDRIWEEAVERGFVSAGARGEYDAKEILLLTCIPGFSTTEKATKISGRGVGMDAVKGKIEYLGGTVEIRSGMGEGTSFTLRLPLTLAILQALLVRSNGQTFAVPLASVEEVYSTDEVRLETIDGCSVMVMRDESVVRVHRLDSILYGADPTGDLPPHSSIVLLRAGQELKALNVDSFAGRTEVVVKPLSDVFRDTKGFSGATVSGDGDVLLIIDPRTIFTSQEPQR